MEKLAVEGSFFGSNHQTVLTTEESEGVRLAENETQEINGSTTEIKPTHDVEGDSKNSKQHESKFREQKEESEETQDYVRESFTVEDFSEEEADEIGFTPNALSEP